MKSVPKDKGKVGEVAEQVVQKGGANQACLSPVMKTPPPQPLQARADEIIPPVLVYGKNLKKSPGSKSSVGSSSVPLPSAKDFSASKPASAPAKSQLSPILFDQYGSNLDADLLGSQTILEPKALSMTVILDEDSSPSDHDADPSVLKRSKLSEADRTNIGWESPEEWEFDKETLASKIAKLKKNQDGEVHNPPKTTSQVDLAKEVAAVSGVAKARRSEAIPSSSPSPTAAARRSARTKEGAVESMLQKASKHAAVKAGTQPSPPPCCLDDFLAFPATPDSVFLGIAADSGIAQCPLSPREESFVSLIRAKERAQAVIAEAAESLALAKARKCAEEAEANVHRQELGGSSVEPLASNSTVAECPASVALPGVRKKAKKREPACACPPRENLRMTPARQARAAEKMPQ
jgi:hypothetical protein